jgi:hypothetical protein
MAATFIFEGLGWLDRTVWNQRFLYAASAAADLPVFRADMGWVTALGRSRSFLEAEGCIVRYWRQEPINDSNPAWEILVGGPIRIDQTLADTDWSTFLAPDRPHAGSGDAPRVSRGVTDVR